LEWLQITFELSVQYLVSQLALMLVDQKLKHGPDPVSCVMSLLLPAALRWCCSSCCLALP
jgi:hypothetical protein